MVLSSLQRREHFRDEYWRKHDPILRDRLLWRAQTFRHTVHLLPGEKILELGCGQLQFTQALIEVSHGENPITAVTFAQILPEATTPGSKIELLRLDELPGALGGRHFDFVVAMDLLDRDNSAELLPFIHDLLVPGGEAVFYESNPWNPVLKLRSLILKLIGKSDPRNLINRPSLYELLSEIGFVRVYAVFNDFVFAPLTRSLIWFLRNMSILLENAPVIRRMAGSILVHAQKPPRTKESANISLFAHQSLRAAVSVVIPCHNEEANIEPLVERMIDFYGGYLHEIIAVDDVSSDCTYERMLELAAKHSLVKPLRRSAPNGVGLAIADGLAAATGQHVFLIDCDFVDLVPEFRDLFDGAAEGYDVVIGSRFSRHSVLLNYPFLKIVANRAFHAIARLLFWRHMRDVTNNLKIMRRGVVDDLRLREPGFAVNAETGLQPLLLGYKVKEVPISWINRRPGMGISSFGLVRAGGGYWKVLMGLWLNQVFGIGPYRQLSRTSQPSAENALVF